MHVAQRKRRITGTGGKDKTPVMGILERGKDGKSRVRTAVVPNRKKKRFKPKSASTSRPVPRSTPTALLSYEGLAGEYAHKVIDHAVEYVDGNVHTNGLENFWSF